MNRRSFLATSLGATVPLPAQTPIPVIDTHIHLFDPTRKEGVPWPPKTAVMYRKTLPSLLREVSKGLNVVGAIEVECSPWLEDNQWVLDVAATDKIIVGMIGNLEPEKPEFRRQLDRFGKNPLYRGIRYGYLWGRDLGKAVTKPEFISGLQELERRKLTLDTANPSLAVLGDVLRISDKVPGLKVVIDHLPAMRPSAAERKPFEERLKEIGKRAPIYVKLSAVLRPTDEQKVSYALKDHKDRLDLLFETFGPDRVLFGSDWPNSDPSGTYAQVLAIVREYFEPKGRATAEKYFWKNSVKAYGWVKRDPSQPG